MDRVMGLVTLPFEIFIAKDESHDARSSRMGSSSSPLRLSIDTRRAIRDSAPSARPVVAWPAERACTVFDGVSFICDVDAFASTGSAARLIDAGHGA
jgi:hypothetical protein